MKKKLLVICALFFLFSVSTGKLDAQCESSFNLFNLIPGLSEIAEEAEEEPEKKETAKGEMVDGMRVEFKEAMDSYEAFYAEYVEFLDKFAANPSDLKMILQYTELLTSAEELDEKFEAWDDDGDLNSKELKYYADVQARVLEMMAESMEE